MIRALNRVATHRYFYLFLGIFRTLWVVGRTNRRNNTNGYFLRYFGDKNSITAVTQYCKQGNGFY